MIFRYFGQKSYRNRVKGNATVKNVMRFRRTFKRLLVESHLKFYACHTKKGNSFLLVRYVSQVPTASLVRGGARKEQKSKHTHQHPTERRTAESHDTEGNQIPTQTQLGVGGLLGSILALFLCANAEAAG